MFRLCSMCHAASARGKQTTDTGNARAARSIAHEISRAANSPFGLSCAGPGGRSVPRRRAIRGKGSTRMTHSAIRSQNTASISSSCRLRWRDRNLDHLLRIDLNRILCDQLLQERKNLGADTCRAAEPAKYDASMSIAETSAGRYALRLSSLMPSSVRSRRMESGSSGKASCIRYTAPTVCAASRFPGGATKYLSRSLRTALWAAVLHSRKSSELDHNLSMRPSGRTT